MSTLDLIIGILIGMVIAFYSHDYWCEILKRKKLEREEKENAGNIQKS